MNVIDKETAEKIVKECYSIADFCRKVGWLPRGDNYKIFYKYVKEYNLNIFSFYRANINNKLNEKNIKTNEEYFVNGSLKKSSDVIKRLLKYNLIEYKCSSCGITTWKNNPISLLLHHIDGNHFNNALSNLTLLCPNCHSLTDTYCGKKNKSSTNIYNRTPKHTCKICGKRLSKLTKSGLCITCLRETYKNKKLEENFSNTNPNKYKFTLEEVNLKYSELKSWQKVANYYNISLATLKRHKTELAKQ